jgi:putative transcriptional regulator
LTKAKKKSFHERFVEEMTETANDMHALGIIDDNRHKVTMRDLKQLALTDTVLPLSGREIRQLRETANVSQAVFARYLNLTVDHISKLERGAKRPTGAALVLLNVIRRKGIEAIL